MFVFYPKTDTVSVAYDIFARTSVCLFCFVFVTRDLIIHLTLHFFHHNNHSIDAASDKIRKGRTV